MKGLPACLLALAACAHGVPSESPPAASPSISPRAAPNVPPAAALSFTPRYALVYDMAPGTTVRLCEGRPEAPGRGFQVFVPRAGPELARHFDAALAHPLATGWMERCGDDRAALAPPRALAGTIDLVGCDAACSGVALVASVDGDTLPDLVPVHAFIAGD